MLASFYNYFFIFFFFSLFINSCPAAFITAGIIRITRHYYQTLLFFVVCWCACFYYSILSGHRFLSGQVQLDGRKVREKSCELSILPLLQEFKPDLILIPAGFDASEGDNHLITGGYHLSPAAYAEMTAALLWAVLHGKCVMSLEGGNSPRGLADFCGSLCARIAQL